jgi:hypothetical protein
VFAGGAAETTDVVAEPAELEPTPLEAVTTTDSVEPTSPEPREYVGDVAPTTGAQFAPEASQRCH